MFGLCHKHLKIESLLVSKRPIDRVLDLVDDPDGLVCKQDGLDESSDFEGSVLSGLVVDSDPFLEILKGCDER